MGHSPSYEAKLQFQSVIPYIFVGSIRHKMDAIFTHHDSPFFKSAIPMTVDPLLYEEFSQFLRKKFTKGQRKIKDETLEKVFEIANNISGDIQQLCEALWEVSAEREIIGMDKLKSALELIFSREQKSYENYISLLTAIQLKCLMAIAMEGGKRVFSVSFMKSAGFNNPSTVKRAITRLIKLNILFESEDEYRFTNPFFRAWLPHKG